MPSSARADILDLPEPTAEDVAALRRMRELNRMDPDEYLAFLIAFSERHPPTREVTSWPEPFEL
ncbi:MAG TPA: hypothetical protein VF698_19910 [Thermoanaerobaculia bacterium]|jgi:hypothetical protein